MEPFWHRPIKDEDFGSICQFPQDENELFFMFPKADYPLTIEQLKSAIENRSDSTVILLDNTVIGLANFYEKIIGQYCSIGNVIIHPLFRGKNAGKYLISLIENIAVQKYNSVETRISCFNQNVAGLLLYSKLGYFPFEIERQLDKKSMPVALIKLKKELRK